MRLRLNQRGGTASRYAEGRGLFLRLLLLLRHAPGFLRPLGESSPGLRHFKE
jgi:hypothetical protein